MRISLPLPPKGKSSRTSSTTSLEPNGGNRKYDASQPEPYRRLVESEPYNARRLHLLAQIPTEKTSYRFTDPV